MTDGTPPHEFHRPADGSVADRPAPRVRLSAADEAAVDAVLGEGFDPARTPADERQARVAALLRSLDRLPDAEGPRTGDPALVDATLARIERFERTRGTTEADRPTRAAGLPVVPVGHEAAVAGRLPWHRNLLGAAAAIAILATLAFWADGMRPADRGLVQAGVVALPDWDVARARAEVEQADPDAAGPGVVRGEIWMVPDVSGRPAFFLLTADAEPEVRARMARAGGRAMGRIVLAPVRPAAAAPGD